jgi:hypothetical protein
VTARKIAGDLAAHVPPELLAKDDGS